MSKKIMLQNVAIMLWVFLFWGCSIFSPCSDEELLRITSPDSKVDAVMMRRDCGATTSYSYSIYIIHKGGELKGWLTKKTESVFVADHVDGESLQWLAPRLLEIKYKQARIFEFTNFWQSRDVDDFSYVVEIRETPLTPPPSLSERDRWVTEEK